MRGLKAEWEGEAEEGEAEEERGLRRERLRGRGRLRKERLRRRERLRKERLRRERGDVNACVLKCQALCTICL